MKWLKISKKTIGTLEYEEAHSSHSKNNTRKKLVFSKLFSTCLEEIFGDILEKSTTLDFYSDLQPKIFDRVAKLHSACTEARFR